MEEVGVSEIMIKEVITMSPTDNLKDAYQIMNQNRIDTLPIIQNKKVVGIITRSDLKRNHHSINSKTKIIAIMSKEPISVSEESTISEVKRIISNNRIRCVLVCDSNNHLLGLVTFREIKRFEDFNRFRQNEPKSKENEIDELEDGFEPKSGDIFETDEVFINQSPYQKNK